MEGVRIKVKAVGVALALLLVPGIAHAHLVTTGFGSFYDGLVHVMMTPTDGMIALGIALFSGLRGKETARRTLIFFPAAWLVGGVLGIVLPIGRELPFLTTASLIFVGGLVASDRAVSPKFVMGVTSVIGLLHGYLNMATPKSGGTLELIGATTAVFIIVTLLPALVVSLKKKWMRIAVRVAGSWIVAIGILTFGWLSRGKW